MGDHNDRKNRDRCTWANCVDPDQTAPFGQSDQGLHGLPFRKESAKFQAYPWISKFNVLQIL